MSQATSELVSAVESLNKRVTERVDNAVEQSTKAAQTATQVESHLRELEQHVATMGSNIGAGRPGASGPSLANSFIANDSFAAMQKGANSTGRVEIQAPLNAITNTGEGGTEHNVQPDRASSIFNDPRRALSILDLMPTLPVTSKTFEYLRLNGYQNAAAFQLNEGDQKAEGDMPTELVDTPITTIAHFVRASAQIIDDAPSLEQQINSLLRYGLMAKLESAIIAGDGSKGTIDGLLNQATAYTATATDTADKIGQAVTELNSNGWSANAAVMNPTDWFAVSSARATDDQYILGSPRNPAPPALWNVPVATTPSLAAGNVLVMDTTQTAVLDRQQPTLMASRVDGNNMTTNMVTILAEMRAGLAVFSTGAVLSLDLTASG